MGALTLQKVNPMSFSGQMSPAPKAPLFPWWIGVPVWFALLAPNGYLLLWIYIGVVGSAGGHEKQLVQAMFIAVAATVFISLCFLLWRKYITAYVLLCLSNPVAIATVALVLRTIPKTE